MGTRKQNERKFGNWRELPDGGREYWRDVEGTVSGRARYVKVVNSEEVTTSLHQEIYDSANRLVEIHHKFPVDTGHQKV